MPIFRYFVCVGGALLALLFVANFAFPNAPATETIATAGGDLPIIRIRSDRKLPERVVLDTSQPATAPTAPKMAETAAPPQPAEASAPRPEMSAKARVRETFAQFVPGGSKAEASAVKKAEVKPPSQPKRKVAKSRWAPQPAGRPMMLVAQQPHFGLFNMTW